MWALEKSCWKPGPSTVDTSYASVVYFMSAELPRCPQRWTDARTCSYRHRGPNQRFCCCTELWIGVFWVMCYRCFFCLTLSWLNCAAPHSEGPDWSELVEGCPGLRASCPAPLWNQRGSAYVPWSGLEMWINQVGRSACVGEIEPSYGEESKHKVWVQDID